MSLHNFNVVICVEDEAIIKNVQETAEKTILNNITQAVLDVISEKRYGYRSSGRDYSPLKRMVGDKVDEILVKHKDEIIDGAINELASRLNRSKAVKEAVKEMLNGESEE